MHGCKNILYLYIIFENCLKLIDNEDKESIILGDINCDLLDNNPTSLISEFKFITNLYQYEQLIKELTRITKDTSTLIRSFLYNKQQPDYFKWSDGYDHQ